MDTIEHDGRTFELFTHEGTGWFQPCALARRMMDTSGMLINPFGRTVRGHYVEDTGPSPQHNLRLDPSDGLLLIAYMFWDFQSTFRRSRRPQHELLDALRIDGVAPSLRRHDQLQYQHLHHPLPFTGVLGCARLRRTDPNGRWPGAMRYEDVRHLHLRDGRLEREEIIERPTRKSPTPPEHMRGRLNDWNNDPKQEHPLGIFAPLGF